MLREAGNMMILDSLIDGIYKKAAVRKIEDVRIGLGYTAVLLDNGSCGLAYTFRNELGYCCCILKEAGQIKGLKCGDVIQWVKDANLARTAVGLATINALIQEDVKDYKCGNIFNNLQLTPENILGVIGDFGPFLKNIRKQVKDMYVFEKKVHKIQGYMYPAELTDKYLPKCDVVIITSTSILNKTFEDIIKKCKNAREIILIGPSTPLYPELFKKYNVTYLAGVVVCKAEQVLDIVSQGGGTRSLGNSVKQACIKI